MQPNNSKPWQHIVLENALDAVVGIDTSGLIIDWNQQAVEIFGYSKSEMIGQLLAPIIIPKEYRSAHEEGMKHFLSTGVGPILNRRIEFEAIHESGKKFPVELTVIPVSFNDSYRFYSFIRDISIRKKTEKELFLKSELIEHSLNAIDIIDSSGKFIYANSSYLKMWGYDSIEEVLGTSPEPHCADPTTPGKIIAALKETGNCDLEFVARKKDGSLFDVRMWSRLHRDTEGNEFYPTTSIDISEENKAKKELLASEDQYHTIFAKAPVGILNTAPSGKIINANDKFCDMLGYTREELKDLTFRDITHPEDREEDFLLIDKMRTDAVEIYDREKRYLKKDGTSLWVHVTGQMLTHSDGTPKHSVTVVLDISERKKLEEQMSLLSQLTMELLNEPLGYRERIQKIANTLIPKVADWAIIDILNKDGEITLAAVAHRDPAKIKQAQKLRTKYPPDADRPIGPAHVINTQVPDLVPLITEKLLTSLCQNDEHLSLMKSLGLKSYMCVPIHAHGQILGSLTLVSESKQYDLKDLEFAQELSTRAALAIYNSQLYSDAQESLRARDEFLSIASHELKTPLTSLKLQTQLQGRMGRKNDPRAYSKSHIDENTKKCDRLISKLDRLIDDMLDISRIRTGQLSVMKEEFDLVPIIKDLVSRIHGFYKDITLTSPKQCLLTADPMRVEQVVSNLLQNAVKYGNNAPIEVTLSSNKSNVLLSVKDQGIGISPENLEIVFNRFERAVKADEISGLGLGLFISQQIVKAHDGRIWVESELGKGAIFYMELPKS